MQYNGILAHVFYKYLYINIFGLKYIIFNIHVKCNAYTILCHPTAAALPDHRTAPLPKLIFYGPILSMYSMQNIAQIHLNGKIALIARICRFSLLLLLVLLLLLFYHFYHSHSFSLSLHLTLSVFLYSI